MSTRTVTVKNAVTSWIEQAKPSKRHATDGRLFLDSTAGAQKQAFVFFAFPAPVGSTITAATLRAFTKDSWGGTSPTLTVQRVSAKYVNGKLTWSNAPGVTGPTATSSHASSGDLDKWEWPVAPLLQPIADGAAWYGFRIVTNATTARALRAGRFELDVTWSDAPQQPTTLSPSGGAYVGTSKPLLEADFTDPDGSTTLASMQVQLKSASTPWSKSAGFTTPDFDSGEVAVTAGAKARLDLSATAYAGAASGVDVYWTTRLKDSSGQWSPWSTPERWKYAAKGTLTITSPAAASPTLNDYTPPIVWTFTGATATKHRVLVRRASDGVTLYDSGQVSGTGTQETVAAKNGDAVLEVGGSYVVEVRVWDDKLRVGTATDPEYAVATQTFSVAAGGTAGVTALAGAKSSGIVPGYTLTFSRASAPDSFVFTLNGTPVATDVLASDVLVSGSNYSYTFRNVRPNTPVDFGVSAVVNGVASPVQKVTDTVKVGGLWLIDQGDAANSSIFVAKTGGSTLDLGEDGDTLIPLGSEYGVRITQSLRGYEGTVTGVLLDYNGVTRDQWVDRALTMRGKPGTVYLLVIGTESFKVVIGNLKVRPTGDSAPGMRPISFDFWQVSSQRIKAGV